MISLSSLQMRFGNKILFQDVSLQFKPQVRYGIIGANGCGKSTLLKLINREMEAFSGNIQIPKETKIGVLEQDQNALDKEIILNAVMMAKIQLWAAWQEKDRILQGHVGEKEAQRLSLLEEIIESEGGYNAKALAAQILSGLGIKNDRHDLPVSTLSGGYKIRVLLARLLFSSPDIMLLDEPTNHLDLYSVLWLQDWLCKFKGTIILVSHDYDFLEGVCQAIADIDFGTIRIYPGNMSAFEKQKEAFLTLHEKELISQDKKREELEKFVERFRYKATKAAQAQSRLKELEKMEEIEELSSSRRTPIFHIPIIRKSGRIAIQAQNICKSYGAVKVLNRVNFEMERGEKVAIVGPNGIGKSTLLKILSGHLKADFGEVEPGYESHLGWFAQDQFEILDSSLSVLDWMLDQFPSMTYSQLRGALGKVLISGEMAEKKISTLSGGEASRLVFAQLSLKQPNLLLLDEPTNHLDLESIESLIQALQKYEGSLIVVSHNRSLVSRVATRILELQPDGCLEFPGGYEEFLQHARQDWLTAALSKQTQTEKKNDEKSAQKSREERKSAQKELRQLQKQNEALEEKQGNLEEELKNCDKIMSDMDLFLKMSPQEQRDLVHKREAILKETEICLEQWEKINLEIEELEKNSIVQT